MFRACEWSGVGRKSGGAEHGSGNAEDDGAGGRGVGTEWGAG